MILDIDEVLSIPMDQNSDYDETQGSVISTQQFSEKTAKTKTPASSHQDAQDVGWLDVIRVEILPQSDQDTEKIYLHGQYDVRQTRQRYLS